MSQNGCGSRCNVERFLAMLFYYTNIHAIAYTMT